MTKTRRMIAEQLKNVDAVCEILDARIPISSRNPDVDELTAGKPRLVVLNRVDQADPDGTKRWAAYFRSLGYAVLKERLRLHKKYGLEWKESCKNPKKKQKGRIFTRRIACVCLQLAGEVIQYYTVYVCH